MPQAEGPPKRVSLVGADDLRKMQEEEGEEPRLEERPGRDDDLALSEMSACPQPASCSRREPRCFGKRQ